MEGRKEGKAGGREGGRGEGREGGREGGEKGGREGGRREGRDSVFATLTIQVLAEELAYNRSLQQFKMFVLDRPLDPQYKVCTLCLCDGVELHVCNPKNVQTLLP